MLNPDNKDRPEHRGPPNGPSSIAALMLHQQRAHAVDQLLEAFFIDFQLLDQPGFGFQYRLPFGGADLIQHDF